MTHKNRKKVKKFHFLVIKTLDPDPGPDSLEMLDPDTNLQHWCQEVLTSSSFAQTESNKKNAILKLK
jgi:hypothetical protein